MSRHTGRSVARGTTVTFLRTGARLGVLSLLLAGLLLAAACGHKTSAAQTLRTCVDRWNQGNMISWGPVTANVAYRRPLARERSNIELSPRRECIVAVAFGIFIFSYLQAVAQTYASERVARDLRTRLKCSVRRKYKTNEELGI